MTRENRGKESNYLGQGQQCMTQRPSVTGANFHMACGAQTLSVLSHTWKKIKRGIIFLDSVNLWNSNVDYWNTATLFTFALSTAGFHVTTAELNSYDRVHMATKLKIFPGWPFPEEVCWPMVQKALHCSSMHTTHTILWSLPFLTPSL